MTYGVAACAGVLAFAFRILTFRGLPNDHYMYLSSAQQILLGDLPGRDFIEPGMLLQVLLSAAAQAVAPGLLSEAVLTATMLGVAAAATCLAVAWITGSVTAGAAAAAFEVLAQPRLYSFPKILVPAVVILAVLLYARRAGISRLCLLAGCIAAAFLLRHDLGGYAAIAGAVGVALAHDSRGAAIRASLSLTAAVLLALIPYWAYLEVSGGVAEHVRLALEFARAEAHQFTFAWPSLRAADVQSSELAWDAHHAAAFLFYLGCALPVLAGLLLLGGAARGDRVVRASVGAAVVLGAWYAAVILRHPLTARVPDLAAIYAVLGAWVAVALLRLRPGAALATHATRAAAAVVVCAVAATAIASIDMVSEVRVQLQEARVSGPYLAERARKFAASGLAAPWREYWPAGDVPPVIEYLHSCTTREQRIWLTWPAPEYYVFARRGFGGGHPITLAAHSYTTERDQQLTIERLHRQRVPIVLINESTRQELASGYPLVDAYLRHRYVSVGTFRIRDGSEIAVAVRQALRPSRYFGDEQWPCELTPDPDADASASVDVLP